MKIRLEPQLEKLRAAVNAASAKRVGPLVEKIGGEQRFSQELWCAVRDPGLTRLPFAEESGGDGGTVRAYAAATCEVARHSAVGALYPGTTIQVAMALLRYGSAGQIEQLVPRLVSGELIAAWAITEPATGADPRHITTGARTLDDHLGACLVNTSLPGLDTGEASEAMCMGGAEAHPVALADMRVPKDSLVGPPDAGFHVMLEGEALGKVRAAAICVGIARRALDEAASARLVTGRAALRSADTALHFCGAYRLTRDMVVKRLYREAAFFEVAQGASEIQKIIAAGELLTAAARGVG